MKKLVLIAALAAITGTAAAADVGIRASRNGSTDLNSAGVTVGTTVAGIKTEAAFDRSTVGQNNVNRISLVGVYDVTKVAGVTLSAKAGAAYVDPTVGSSGYAGLVGIGASYPLTKTVSLVADVAHQSGQSKVRAYDGNIVSAGLKVQF